MRLLAVQRPCLPRPLQALRQNDHRAERPSRKRMISQRMASGQTHVNTLEMDERKLIDLVFENNTQRV